MPTSCLLRPKIKTPKHLNTKSCSDAERFSALHTKTQRSYLRGFCNFLHCSRLECKNTILLFLIVMPILILILGAMAGFLCVYRPQNKAPLILSNPHWCSFADISCFRVNPCGTLERKTQGVGVPSAAVPNECSQKGFGCSILNNSQKHMIRRDQLFLIKSMVLVVSN